jgi:hypothetical protein
MGANSNVVDLRLLCWGELDSELGRGQFRLHRQRHKKTTTATAMAMAAATATAHGKVSGNNGQYPRQVCDDGGTTPTHRALADAQRSRSRN